MAGTNIPQNIIQAILYIIALDNLQLSPGIAPPPAAKKWQNWTWTQEESDFWTALRNVLEPLLEPYSNKNVNRDERNQIKLAIKSAREYASFDVNGHRLLLKIAAHGDEHDWLVANIKFGTPLAKKPGIAKSDSPALKQPSLKVTRNILYEHELSVLDPDAPTSRKLPPGMKFAKVYRFIGTAPPSKLSDYEFYANARRGKVTVKFSSGELSGNVKHYAYYIARYESNKGELGEPCAMESAEILF